MNIGKQMTGIPPSIRSAATATKVGNQIIIFGGRNQEEFYSDIYFLRLGTFFRFLN